jgi:hypothetical protein
VISKAYLKYIEKQPKLKTLKPETKNKWKLELVPRRRPPSKPTKSFCLKKQETICYWIKQNLNTTCRIDLSLSSERKWPISNSYSLAKGNHKLFKQLLTKGQCPYQNMEIHSLYRLKNHCKE